ncbi:MAG: hypothetical protein RLZZ500_667, partial [Bacteroidota bacterium]
ENDCKDLLIKFGDSDSIIPYFFLYQFNNELFKDKFFEINEICEKLPTAKNLYVKSIIKNRLK